MTTDAGKILSRPTAAHRAANAPASSTRQRAVGRSFHVAPPVEEIAAVHGAENYLIEFCAAGIEALPWELRPAATKNAVNHLVVLTLADEVRAELFLEAIAAAASITPTVLRAQVEDRCWFYQNFQRLYADRETKQQAVAEITRIITS